MSHISVIALRTVPYDGVSYKTGESLLVDDRHLKVLIAFGAVKLRGGQSEVNQAPPETAQPQKTRRSRQRYDTREMRAREI